MDGVVLVRGRLGDPHPHRPAHGGLKGYNSLQ